ncbi:MULTISPECIES: hypothetical protein [Nocardia]|uniref:hypothetical protein n=1 Tax=Nocardia TaxID=1817 RepID=UPI0013008163|nr:MULTISPECIES: hypothetical protein [Nocardia]
MNQSSMPRRLTSVVAAALTCVGLGASVSTAPASASPSYDCPGGQLCGWDGRDGKGAMIFQFDPSCVLHDIGNGGVGDRLTSAT